LLSLSMNGGRTKESPLDVSIFYYIRANSSLQKHLFFCIRNPLSYMEHIFLYIYGVIPCLTLLSLSPHSGSATYTHYSEYAFGSPRVFGGSETPYGIPLRHNRYNPTRLQALETGFTTHGRRDEEWNQSLHTKLM